MSTLEQEIHTIGRRAREASRSLARLTADQKNAILEVRAGTGGEEASLFSYKLFNG